VLNRQFPAQPSRCGNAGSGGTVPKFWPAVWVHEVGATSKSTLWKFAPLGKLNVTVPPAAIVMSAGPADPASSK
jgi:hypothetical protein